MRIDLTEAQVSLTVSALENLRRILANGGATEKATDEILSKMRTALNKVAAKK